MPSYKDQHPATFWSVVQELDECGIRRSLPAWLITVPILYVIMLNAALGFVALSPYLSNYLGCDRRESVELLFTIGAAFLAVQQWRFAKTEASLDKFYERLNLTNNRLDLWRYARPVIRKKWLEERTFEAEMYTCLEVDNLEYVIQRYQRGYMDPRDAQRELNCFRSRCQPEGWFRALALKVAYSGGYKPETIDALEKLCNTCMCKKNCINCTTVAGRGRDPEPDGKAFGEQ